MNPALQRYLEAASGLTKLTATKAERVVKDLVKSGEAAGEQAQELVEDLLERRRRNQEALVALVKAEARRTVRAMGLATNTEVTRLQKQIADLKRELAEVERVAASTGGKAAKKTAKKAAAKKTAKKSAAKKSTAKKSTAKKAAKKSSS